MLKRLSYLLAGGAIVCFWFVIMFALFFTAMQMFSDQDPMNTYGHSLQADNDFYNEHRDDLKELQKEALIEVLDTYTVDIIKQ